MYAVVETGGKQYRVTEGMKLAVEKLDVEKSKSVKLDKVLLIAKDDAVTLGRPYVAGASVDATVLIQDRDDKVLIIKFKSKTGYHRKRGHRQCFTYLKIDKIHAK